MSTCCLTILSILAFLGILLAGALLPCPEEPEDNRPLPSCLWDEL